MILKRLFTTSQVKCTYRYLHTQKYFELVRTLLYFAISLSIFIGGYVQTGNRNNLLTIVAILGCLPACKSLVSMIMFMRYKGCTDEAAKQIAMHEIEANCLYDCVFTSYQKNYEISHICVCSNTVCGYAKQLSFPEKEFEHHLIEHLKLDGYQNVTVKIFTSLPKYLERLDQMRELIPDEKTTQGILETIKSICL